MLDDIEKQTFWDDLTYISKQQTLELLQRYNAFQKALKRCVVVELICFIFLLIIFLPNFKNNDTNFVILFMMFCLFAVIYAVSTYLNNFRKKFEDHRTEMKKFLTGSFCIHNSNCTCRDDYARYLKDIRRINLMF